MRLHLMNLKPGKKLKEKNQFKFHKKKVVMINHLKCNQCIVQELHKNQEVEVEDKVVVIVLGVENQDFDY